MKPFTLLFEILLVDYFTFMMSNHFITVWSLQLRYNSYLNYSIISLKLIVYPRFKPHQSKLRFKIHQSN